jgi:hypothetical protein
VFHTRYGSKRRATHIAITYQRGGLAVKKNLVQLLSLPISYIYLIHFQSAIVEPLRPPARLIIFSLHFIGSEEVVGFKGPHLKSYVLWRAIANWQY